MTTVADIVNRAFEIIGVNAAGESTATADSNLAVNALVSLLDLWQLDPQSVVGLQELTYTPAAGAKTVTIGAAGQIVSAMPARIEPSSFYRINGIDMPLAIADSFDEYAAIAAKSTQGPPSIAYLMRGNTEVGTLYLGPASDGTYELHLWVPQQNVQGFATLTSGTTLTLPNGYKKMLEDNLAEELLTSFSVPDVIGTKVMRAAARSRRKVKRGNFVSHQLQNRVRAHYDIRTA